LYGDLRQWIAHEALRMAKVPVPTEQLAARRVLRILVIGQSNAGNWGENPVAADRCILNFHAGALYRAEDPLLGSDGAGGSPWSRFGADSCRALGVDFIVFAMVSRGGRSVASFLSGGDQHRAMVDTVRSMAGAGLAPDYVFYFQGEADALRNMGAEAYRRGLETLVGELRAGGVQAPILVSRTSWLPRMRANEEIRKAQAAVVDPARGVLAGPDTDQFGYAWRYDGLHFSDDGLMLVSRAWVEALLAARPGPSR
jgi:lysophospholipase L1-like esterase